MNDSDNKEYYIDSVSKFLKLKQSQLYNSNHLRGRWMYRGIKNYEYELLPNIGRLLGEEPFISIEDLYCYEQTAFNDFIINTYDSLRENNLFIILAVAQHHGLKTRLLDWTLSPLIALFFAVEDETKIDIDGALFAFQTQFFFNDFSKYSSPFNKNLNEYHFIYSPSLSPRNKAQQGLFQLFKNPTVKFEDAFNLRKYRIPAQNKKMIKKELFDLGISYNTVFPDFDGICKSINYFSFEKKSK